METVRHGYAEEEFKGEEGELLETKEEEPGGRLSLRDVLLPRSIALELLRQGVANGLDFNEVIIIANNHWSPQEVMMAFGWMIKKNGTRLSTDLIFNELQQAFDLLALLPDD